MCHHPDSKLHSHVYMCHHPDSKLDHVYVCHLPQHPKAEVVAEGHEVLDAAVVDGAVEGHLLVCGVVGPHLLSVLAYGSLETSAS